MTVNRTIGFSIFITLFLIEFFSPANTPARVFHVDSAGGNDGNNGLSLSTAWKSLGQVNAAFKAKVVQAGDTVAFKRGDIFSGELNVSLSGRPGKPVVIGAFGEGALPVIDAVSHYYGVSLHGSHLVIGSLRVANARSAAFFIAGGSSRISLRDCTLLSTIYVDTPVGVLFGEGKASEITVQRVTLGNCTDSGFRLGSGACVTGLTIDTVAADSACYGFYAERADLVRLRILNSSFNHTLHSGIRLERVTARNLECIDTETSGSRVNGVYLNGDLTGVRLSGLTIDSSGGHGLCIDTFSANDIIVEKCTLTGSKNERNGLSLDGQGRDCHITDTIASRNNGDGFNVHGSWKNVVLERCSAHENGNDGRGWDGDGYTFHDDSTGRMIRCTARNNKKSAVAHVHQSSLYMERCIFTHESNGAIPLVYLQGKRFTLINSVIYSNSRIGTGLQCIEGNIVVRNTIIQGFDLGFENRRAVVAQDHNIVFGSKSAAWKGLASGEGPLSVDPLFTNPAALDFTVQPGSPCIDAGVDTGSDEDFAGTPAPRGKAPDIGVFEKQ